MFKFANIALPSLLVLSTVAQAAESRLAQSKPEQPTPAEDEISQPDSEPSPEEAADSSDESEAGPSALVRQTKKNAVEVFADYNTFTSKREYFNPAAFGLRAYWFNSPDIKYGFSLALEQFVYETDVKTFTPGATGVQFSYNDAKRKGSAVRYAANAQYFISDSMNASFSLFGANGKTEKKGSYDSATYTRSGLTVAFGNQWSWDDYTFRFDWLTLTYNFALKIGDENVIDTYPSNKNGGMIVISGLAFGSEW